MSFRSKVERIVLEMGEGEVLGEIATKVKDLALRQLVEEIPKHFDKIFKERLGELDEIIKERVKEIMLVEDENNKVDIK